MEEQAGGYISELHFNNGKTLAVKQNGIVVFVGPNNVGKSQTLKDIYNLAYQKMPSVVVTDISIVKNDKSIVEHLNKICASSDHGNYISYQLLNHTFTSNNSTDTKFHRSPVYSDYRDLFIANLDTAARLVICNAPQNIDRDKPKTHPIHFAAFNTKYRQWLSDNFKKAFGEEIMPNITFGGHIPLTIGSHIKINPSNPGNIEIEDIENYAEVIGSYKQVHNQGDGIKSFIGILLYLMLDYYRTFLIDEPESFLHPPQARIMGQIIGNSLSDYQQAFISTHSEEIVKGLLESCPDRLTIVRITRKDDTNDFSILDNDKLNEVWNDPLLKYSNIMSSLFHKTVVLCESDSDCKMYSIIDSHIKHKEGLYPETLFIQCGGKHRMASILKALKALDIDIRIVVDIDILNQEEVFRSLIETAGIKWNSLEREYGIICANLNSQNEQIDRTETKSKIDIIIGKKDSRYLSNKEIEDIRKCLSTKSKWTTIKQGGISSFPPGTARTSFDQINDTLKKNNIYIVPNGEIECFIKQVGGHGNHWVNSVLETYPDLNDPVYNDIKSFIKSINL